MTFARVPRLAAICLTTSLMSAMATADPVAIDIKSEPLPTALKEFARQTRVQVAVQSELTAGKTSSTVSGKYEPADALAALLKGTGLVAYPVNANTYGIRAISGDGPPGFTGKPSTGVVTPGTPVVQLTQTATAGANQTGGPVAPEPASADSEKKDDLSEIVVTGTHIRGAPLSSPVIEITQVDIERSGYTNVGDVIRSLPQNFSGGNNPQNIGSNPFANDNSDNAGTSPNLRGLGSGSTLTLVNGHRLADDTSDGGTDISFIPLAAIERIDVLTDGASAAYGADAVGGVVNFILKKDFDGAQSGALIGNATDGGAHEVQFNQLLGKTWDGGGALLAGRYDKQDPVYASQRDFAELAAQPLSLLPGSEVKSYFLSAHQEISSYSSAFVEALYGTRSAASVSTFPASDNAVAYANADVEQYDVNTGIAFKLPGGWQLTTTGSLSVNLAYQADTSQQPTNEDGRTRSLEEDAEGPVFALPAGNARLALGAGYRREFFSTFFPGYRAGGDRRVGYEYAELAVPIISAGQNLGVHGLELNLSGRQDDYSDTGSKSVPKIGLVFSPTDELALRTSWGKSFRAPPLADKYAPVALLEFAGFPNPVSPTGSSQVLVPSGGNPALKPESATSKTLGLDYTPALLPGFKVSGSYFDLSYNNRITVLPNLFGALESNTYDSFVTRNPSLALQQNLIAAAAASGGVYNETGGPFDPTLTAAVINYTYVNVARQDLKGLDLLLNYKASWSAQTLELFSNATYINFRETLTPTSPQMTLSGTSFYPPKLKLRSGATWSYGPIATTGVVNYLGSEVNTFAAGVPHVSSWTTVDLHLAYSPTWTGWLSGLSASLSVRNLFDKDPPYVQYLGSNFPGANYDSNNASPLGRFVSLQLGKKW